MQPLIDTIATRQRTVGNSPRQKWQLICSSNGQLGWMPTKVAMFDLHAQGLLIPHIGSVMASRPSEAPPNVYPNAAGMPMLPELPSLYLGIIEEKRLVRRYLTCCSSKSQIGSIVK